MNKLINTTLVLISTLSEFFSLQVYLGLDVLVDEDIWESLLTQKCPTIALRDIADIVFTPMKLMNRTFDLNKCKKRNIVPNSPRKEVEGDKYQLVMGM